MKKFLTALALLGMTGGAWAADKKAAPPAADKKPAAAAAPAQGTTGDKLTGEVVDITCYAGHENHGDKHASCAAKCIGAGMPAGILADGKLYVVIMKDHSAPAAKFAAFGGKLVTATGTKVEKNGTNIFEVDTVDAAAK